MKQLFQISTAFIISLFFFSCSMHIEKRRYRQGYYVSISSPNQQKDHTKVFRKTEPRNFVQPNHNHLKVTIEEGDSLQKVITTVSKDHHLPNKKSKLQIRKPGISTSKKKHGIEFVKQQFQQKIKIQDQLKDHPEDIKKDHKKVRRILAWIFGSVSMVLVVTAIVTGLTIGILGLIIAGFTLGFALIFAVLALCVRFINYKNLPDHGTRPEDPNAIKPSYINGSFITAIITAVIAIVGFILAFMIYPIVIAGFVLSVVASIMSVISFSLGFGGLKVGKNIKVILTIIIGFIMLLLAIFGMALPFIP